ncbi:MAG TPA: aldehyde dehydrogenase family protein [Anaerolineales bacterium]|nr:aldehyde dehydrogenase family protein [Anaerolineales bacterium]
MSEYLQALNPATQTVLAQVAITPKEKVRRYVAEMRQAAPVWASFSTLRRASILRQFQKILVGAQEEIVQVMNQNTAKSYQDALIELFVTVDLLSHTVRNAPRWLAWEWLPSGLYFTKLCVQERKPFGVVGVLSPWNYPINLALAPVISALIAGNTVVLKASEWTPAVGALIEDLFQRVPELSPFVRVVYGDGKTGAELVDASPDMVFLTGSVTTAHKVAEVCAKTLTPFAFELGGKDPTLVLADADIAAAAKWCCWGANYNAGQACMSVERVYVMEQVYEQFVMAALKEVEQQRMGYSGEPDNANDLSAIIMPKQLDVIENHLQDALAKGARILTGGKRHGNFFQPTLLVDVNHDMLIMQAETFGPILPIMKVESEKQAIRLANDSPFGLGASVWSQDLAHATRIARQLQVGTVLINDAIAQFGIPSLPFGGVKQSGNARTHGKEGVLQFTRTQNYTIGLPPLPFDLATILRKPGQYHFARYLFHLLFGVTPQQKLKPLSEALNSVEGRRTQQGLHTKLAAFGLLGLFSAMLGAFFWQKKRRTF